jgi:esterase/lipase superfamily enzyme
VAHFDLQQGEAPTLVLSGTGCESMHLTVRGITSSGPSTIMSRKYHFADRNVNVEYEFAFDDLSPYREIEIDPVLYGTEGTPYELRVSMRNASDRKPTVIGTASGTLGQTRGGATSEPTATGSDAPLVCVDLSAAYRSARAKNGKPRREAAAAPREPKPRAAAKAQPLEDMIDLSQDFSLGEGPGVESTVASVRAADEEAKNYPVWYGTNRTPVFGNGKLTGYSAVRDKDVHYGRCTVHIPESHRKGEVGSSFWKRLISREDDRLKLIEMLGMQRELFWKGFADQLRAADVGKRHAVVFIHGYNVSFESAALRAAQIGCDLSIEGAMAFYSWPSRGSLDGYFADEATIQYSARYITQFLQDVAALADAEKVHVIAHSMGNRAVFEAVREMVDRAQEEAHTPFSQFILAAPDVDADYFQQFAEAYAKIAARTTMYVSDRDRAVWASRFLHGGEARVGLAPPFQVVSGIDTIFAEEVDESMIGHGYVASAWELLNDMHQMIHLDADAKVRFSVKRSGSGHWVLRGTV